MAPTLASKRRRVEEGMQGRIRPKKKIRKQRAYHSDSEDEEEEQQQKKPTQTVQAPATAAPSSKKKSDKKQPERKQPVSSPDIDEEDDDILNQEVESEEDQSEAEESPEGEESSADEKSSTSKSNKPKKSSKSLLASDSEDEEGADDEYDLDSEEEDDDDEENPSSKPKQRKIPKRSDPTAFSTSISKILSTKIPTSSRADPLLSRSRTTAQTTADISNEKLEARARAKLRAQRKEELEKGHVIDVLGVDRGDAGNTAETERRLRKIAQRGVIKLFNAVRVAQVRGEELAREERRSRATVGMDERKKHVNEVSKQGFLELINGKGNKKISIEEA
ncbi:hypothetical protein AAP_01561 [Ascosphaera apis ARSEF 7405]|uniref:DUF1665 domain-containing protein n=1 Tax=Ascosphaera apis ARSEF 7405 TaxID=392613 RepID=A0A162IL80_9EURO|nr:hypothetical protein AAP_01561 [Ascosphaera apis ARSEF 7405]